jgi:tryptophan 2,3-dioxygenase
MGARALRRKGRGALAAKSWQRPGMSRKPTAYWDYIKVEELLSLQAGLGPTEESLTNDEVMFIVVHQIDELWFKLIVRELVSVRNLFAKVPVPEQSLASAVRGIRRMELLTRHVAGHFSVMETLTTRDYLAFRDKLSPASGFQSAQLREIEILLGLPDAERIPLGHEHNYRQALRGAEGPSPALERVEARLQDKPTLLSAIDEWLYRTPIQGSIPGVVDDERNVRRFIDAYCVAHARAVSVTRKLAHTDAMTEADEARLAASARSFLLGEEVPEAERARRSRIRAALVFIESYRELPLLAWPREIIDSVLAFEQAFVIFRQLHARMVERVIGRRTGTGGSAGVDYLDQTALQYRVFRDVWAVRTVLVREAELPALEAPEFYGFAGD